MSTGDVRRLTMLAALVAAWMLGPLIAGYSVWLGLMAGIAGQDAHAYWLTAHQPRLYGPGPGELDAYLYSPAFALAIKPVAMLPWRMFYTAWVILEGALLAWLVAPLSWRWSVPLFLLCVPELLVGNVYVLMATMCAVGLRHPSAWAFGALTKITAGVGLVWFLARHDYRAAVTAAAVTAAVMAVSYAADPQAWVAWFAFLAREAGDSGWMPARVLAAVVFTVVCARRGRTWGVPVAVVLAAPVAGALAALVPLVAIPRLILESDRGAVGVNPGTGRVLPDRLAERGVEGRQ